MPAIHSTFLQVSIPAIAGVFLVITLAFVALGWNVHPEGTVPPGVNVAGVSIGEMSSDDARAALQHHFSGFSQRPLVLTYHDRVWVPTMADLGAEFDYEQTVQRATFSQSRVKRAQIRLFGAEQIDIAMRMKLDDAQLQTFIQSIAQEINKSPRAPELRFEDGRLTISDAQMGVQIDQDSVSESVVTALFNLDSDPVEIPYTEIAPDFTDDDVEAAKTLIHEALSDPLTIRFEDQAWTIDPERFAEFLRLQPGENGTMELAFHHDPLISYLDGLIGDINRPARNAQIAWGGHGVVATSPSQYGIERDLHAMIPRLEEAIAEGQREIELTYNVTRPAIDSNNLGDLGITSLMSQGESAFWNSAPSRAHNIAVAAGYLDGTLIPPGHEFSFNRAVGEISLDRGYQEGYVIQAERTVEGVGGGVCQVSTTVFRAAFFSGLPITERHPHAYLVGFYEQGDWPLGFDAAIFQPDVDFRFVNSTDSYMLMHTHVADQRLYVNLYGPDLGYSVELGEAVVQSRTDPPPDVEVLDESLAPGERRQVEEAKPGLEVTLPRTVTNRDGDVVRQDYFYSNFQAWGNRFLVGPGVSPHAQDPSEVPTSGAPSGEIIEGELEQNENDSP